jgi:hypothetical protein
MATTLDGSTISSARRLRIQSRQISSAQASRPGKQHAARLQRLAPFMILNRRERFTPGDIVSAISSVLALNGEVLGGTYHEDNE